MLLHFSFVTVGSTSLTNSNQHLAFKFHFIRAARNSQAIIEKHGDENLSGLLPKFLPTCRRLRAVQQTVRVLVRLLSIQQVIAELQRQSKLTFFCNVLIEQQEDQNVDNLEWKPERYWIVIIFWSVFGLKWNVQRALPAARFPPTGTIHLRTNYSSNRCH